MARQDGRQWLLGAAGAVVLLVGLPFVLLPIGCSPTAPQEGPTVELPADPHTIVVTLKSQPPGALATVDGQSRGRTPLRLQGHANDVLEVVLTAPGRDPVHHYLLLKAGQPEVTWTLPAPQTAAAPATVVPPPVAAVVPPPALSGHAVVPDVVTPLHDAGDYASLDARALAVSDSQSRTLDALAASLTQGLTDPQDKARVIYTWIAHHVRYDVDAFFHMQMLDSKAETVLRTRSTLCAGYASLFDALAGRAGLESRVVTGNGKGVDEINPNNKDPINHAWNAVKLGGQWRLLDVTWGSGAMKPDHQYVQREEDFYFLTPPEAFVYSHFPEDAKDQCLPHPLTWDQYSALPHVEPEYFKDGLSLPEGTGAVLRCDGSLSLHVGAPDGILVTGQVEDGNGVQHKEWAFSQRDGGQFDMHVTVPAAGHYRLHVFSRVAGSDSKMYRNAVTFKLESSGAGQPTAFPMLYRDFVSDKAYLFEPMDAQLSASRPQTFRVRVPGANAVSVICGDQWMPLVKDGDLFSGTVSLTPGEVYVVPVYDNERDHHSILRYVAR